MVIGLNNTNISKDSNNCIHCIHGKTQKFPFPRTRVNRAFGILELIHSDICGPLTLPTYSGFQYFMTLSDDYSWYCTIYLLRHKSDVFKTFRQWKTYIENQFREKIKILKLDNGGEYTSKDFNSFCIEQGIHRQLTTPYTLQHNGVAEQKNLTLMNAIWSMLHDSQLSKPYWGKAILTANYLQIGFQHQH